VNEFQICAMSEIRRFGFTACRRPPLFFSAYFGTEAIIVVDERDHVFADGPGDSDLRLDRHGFSMIQIRRRLEFRVRSRLYASNIFGT
jgi:hypothetical protein